MSFLDSIKAIKDRLKSTDTKVTTLCGAIVIETKDGRIVQETQSPGFVVDIKPDLQVAPVIEYVFMGSQDPAWDRELMNKHRINRILSLGIEVPKFGNIVYHFLPILDYPEFELKPFIHQAFIIIDSARKSKEGIYIHCNAGVSRSPTFAIAYLMKEKSWTYEQAFDYLKNIRPCIKPNKGFVQQLMNL